MRGRPPKPTALKLADGDTRKLGANKHAANIAAHGDIPAGLPDMPSGLGKIAKQHWKFLMETPGADKLFREADAGTLAGLCQMYEGFMQQAAIAADMEKVARDKSVSPDMRAMAAGNAIEAHKLAEKLYGRYLNGADRCGLNASARARLQLGANEESKKPFGVLPPPAEWKQRQGVSA